MIPKDFIKWTRLFDGAYKYKQNNKAYASEHFHVLSNPDSKDIVYSSESISRAKTGETLKIRTNHVYTDDYKFKNASVEKLLGNQYSKELFKYNLMKGVLDYSFEDYDKKIDKLSIDTSQNFHIQTPDALTTLIFVLSRGLSHSDDIIQKIYFADNVWKYENEVNQKLITIVRPGKGIKDQITVNNHKLKSLCFTIYEDEEHQRSQQAAPQVYLSDHYGIPYKITGADETVIEIDFLNDLREESIKLDLEKTT